MWTLPGVKIFQDICLNEIKKVPKSERLTPSSI
jgi:hypothetical protein